MDDLIEIKQECLLRPIEVLRISSVRKAYGFDARLAVIEHR
jgi:hypothetical protein